MNLKLPKTYKTLLAVCVVAGPFVWLVLSEDGKRRSDLFLLHLLGHQPFNVAYANLRPDVGEEQLLGQFPRIEFGCRDRATPLGDRECAAEIGSVNGIPARAVRILFRDGALSAVQLDYRGRWHGVLIDELGRRYGEPRRDAAHERTVLAWPFDRGTLLLPQTLAEDEQATAMWIARRD